MKETEEQKGRGFRSVYCFILHPSSFILSDFIPHPFLLLVARTADC
jgi:hypothetical protein